jgi:cytochrome c553
VTLHSLRGCRAAISALVLGTVTALFAGISHSASAPRALDTMAERVAACTTCHGSQGRATNAGYFPRIAGKPAGYLYNQLLNFRDGRRNYPLMVYLVEHLTDDYLKEIAQHFAAQDIAYPPSVPASATPQVLARGEALVRRGDPARKLPACAQCHGESLTGVNPGIPGLLGLSRDYVYGQLGFWKTGERRAHAPDCMAKIAAELTPDEVSAVSAWLAAQPVPMNSKPAARLTVELPLACGSAGR